MIIYAKYLFGMYTVSIYFVHMYVHMYYSIYYVYILTYVFTIIQKGTSI